MYNKPRGTEDLFNEKIDTINFIEQKLKKLALLNGFNEIRTPSFENKEIYVSSVGDATDIVTKEMFNLKTKNKKEYVLKPEGTASVIRSVIENKIYNSSVLPLKLFYLQSMYRYERPQKGRLRQFNQFGIEIIGTNNKISDIEIIIFARNLLNEFGIYDYKILINSLGSDANTIDQYKKILISSLVDVIKCDDCKIRINKNPLRLLDCKKEKINFDKLPKIYDFLSNNDKNDLNYVINSLKNNKINVELNHSLVRGIDYYTDIVFEIVLKKETNFTLIGGGRYNNLIKKLGGNEIPAIGFAMGIERIRILLEKNKNILINKKTIDVFIITLNNKSQLKALELAFLLRKHNIFTEINYDNSKNIKQQFKISDKYNAKNIIIIGDEELKTNYFNIKNNITKKTNKIYFEEIVEFLKK